MLLVSHCVEIRKESCVSVWSQASRPHQEPQGCRPEARVLAAAFKFPAADLTNYGILGNLLVSLS